MNQLDNHTTCYFPSSFIQQVIPTDEVYPTFRSCSVFLSLSPPRWFDLSQLSFIGRPFFWLATLEICIAVYEAML